MRNIVIDTIARQVTVDGVWLRLTRCQFNILTYLASHPNAVRSQEQLRDAMDNGDDYEDLWVAPMIKRLRQAGFRDEIECVRAVGYAWTGPRPTFRHADAAVADRGIVALMTKPCASIDHADASLADLAGPYLKSGWRLTSWQLVWPSETDAAHGYAVLCKAN